jgi:hypothetical protein
MADLSLKTTLGIVVESVAGTYDAPDSGDTLTVADLRPSIEGITADIREFTGSIHRPGPSVLGKTLTITGRLLLRGPGGSSPPLADAWVQGRILRAAGMTEVVTGTAIPAAPEAIAAGGTTSTVTLGATATGTADLYKAMLLLIEGLGSAGRAQLTMGRSNTSGKLVTLPETAADDLDDTGTKWQLPKQLVYQLGSASPPTLSASCWVGNRRINGEGMAISAFKINMPTSSRESQDVPSIEFTLTGKVHSIVDDLSPPVPPAGLAVPPYRDGKLWVANKQLGGSSFSIDFGAQIGFPPNPNEEDGNETAQLTETTRTVDLTLNQVALTDFDDVTLAEEQGYHSLFALWGLASGNAFGLIVTDMRFNHRSPDNSGSFVTQTGAAYVDGTTKTIALAIPFGLAAF